MKGALQFVVGTTVLSALVAACGTEPTGASSDNSGASGAPATRGDGSAGAIVTDASLASVDGAQIVEASLGNEDTSNTDVDNAADTSSTSDATASKDVALVSADAEAASSTDADAGNSIDAGAASSIDADAASSIDADAPPSLCPGPTLVDTPVLRFIRPVPSQLSLGTDLCKTHWIVDPAGVNDNASRVVGLSSYNVEGGSYGSELFSWTSGTGSVGLGFLPGDASGVREAIFDVIAPNVSAVFGAQYNYGGAFRYAFRWSPSTGLLPIGSLPGLDEALVVGASSDGEVAIGRSRLSSASEGVAFRWTQAEGIVRLDAASHHNTSFPQAITPSGQVIVGSYSDDPAPPYKNGVFRVTPSSPWTDLGKLPNYTQCAPAGLSDDGSIVVGTCSDGSQARVFRWTEPQGMVSLTTPTSQFTHQAFVVSPDGTAVLGVQYDNMFNPAVPSLIPFRWTEATGLVLLQKSDGRVFAWNKADPSVRDARRLIGRLSDLNDAYEAAVWTVGEGAVGLGFWPGDNQSEIDAVSSDGTKLCGLSYKRPIGGERSDDKAVYWDETGIHSLTSELAARGADLTGLESFECRWIGNGSPLLMVGQAAARNHLDYVGWIATLSPMTP